MIDYDNSPLIAHTDYTFEQVRAYKMFDYARRYERTPPAHGIGRKGTIAVMVAGAALIVIQALNPYGSGVPTSVLVVVIITYLLCAAVAVWNYRNKRGLSYTVKQHEKLMSGIMANGQTYTFRGSEFDSETCVPGSVSKGTMGYNTLHSVEETEDAFYLLVNEHGAHIVDKHGFKTGTPQELRNLLAGSLPPEKCKLLEKTP